MDTSVKHYSWAGLDFMIDSDGSVVFLEANRSSHMLLEYLQLHGHTEPIAAVARVMEECGPRSCLLWRRKEDPPESGEGACWIGAELSKHLRHPPLIALVEDNQEEREDLLCSDGRRVCPDSIFRWWYPLPWSYERNGVKVINPNAVWVVVRDKLRCCSHVQGASHFRAPRTFAVENAAEAQLLLEQHPELFEQGFVLKPRIGFGGHGIQVGNRGDALRPFSGSYLLSERVVPTLRDGHYWDVRVFVMAGRYFGGMVRTSPRPVTNVFQGGSVITLEPALSSLLEPAALEAAHLIDQAAETVHRLPPPLDSPTLRVS